MRPEPGPAAPEWTGRTVVCIASGPSLTESDCEIARNAGHPVIVTNTTFRLCLWADAMFGFDTKWWKTYGKEVAENFAGRKFGVTQLSAKYGAESLFGSAWFRSYRNSGCCAMSVAISAGASKIVMLGYDAERSENGATHWHGDHPGNLGNLAMASEWPRLFGIVAKQARGAGVQIVNASRQTRLECFDRGELESVL